MVIAIENMEPTVLVAPPLGLYVHMPWCVQKCPYCDFNSHTLRNDLPEDAYIDTLLLDLAQQESFWSGKTLSSIFIGGGTPSLFSAAAIEKLLCAVKDQLDCADNLEISLEANPGTVEYQRFKDYFSVGVNRLSIGVQSFQDAHLKNLGRIHNGQSAELAIEAVSRAGFENFNTDLMFALPAQTLESALADVQRALEFNPVHISHYQLTLEPETPFYYQRPGLPEQDEAWEIQQACAELLSAQGYDQYEVSAWAKNQKYCEHNLNYWQFGDYLGIGAGAHGKITNASQQTIERYWQVASPRLYMQAVERGSAMAGSDSIELIDRVFEFVMNALRLQQGFSLTDFITRTGLPVSALQPALDDCLQKGLLIVSEEQISCTELGWRFLDSVLQSFLPDPKTEE